MASFEHLAHDFLLSVLGNFPAREMYRRQWGFVNRRHPGKSKQWCRHTYWGRFNPQRQQDDWVFGDKSSALYLLKFAWVSIERHVLVKGTASMDDSSLKHYWQKRQKKLIAALKPSRQQIARQQGGICPICGQSLINGEEIQLHRQQPKAQGSAVLGLLAWGWGHQLPGDALILNFFVLRSYPTGE